ncbi:copper chaperone PCu(A)C [Castellaniella hirudinis]|uniref:copper chaperone PCu(A)C n=1 Tax=Castellaniella hirudinis TaxID=1144617 RepID=UPI0039C219B4
MKIKFTRIASTLGLALALMQPAATAWAHGDHGHGDSHAAMAHGGHDAAAAAAAANLPVSSHVTADACWIRQLPKPTPSGGFLVLHNQGGEPAVIAAVASPDYADVMLHQTTEENGVSKMSMIHQLTIPAGQRVELKPGSYHLMLEGPRDGLTVGDEAHVRFALGDGTAVDAACKVMSAKATRKE